MVIRFALMLNELIKIESEITENGYRDLFFFGSFIAVFSIQIRYCITVFVLGSIIKIAISDELF